MTTEEGGQRIKIYDCRWGEHGKWKTKKHMRSNSEEIRVPDPGNKEAVQGKEVRFSQKYLGLKAFKHAGSNSEVARR